MKLKDPILFIPGIIAPYKKNNWEYFNNIDEYIDSTYYIAPLDNWGTKEERSTELKSFIDNNISEKCFHVISHSKGGIDLEYLLDKYPTYVNKIKSHTSLNCPYKGSIIAVVFWLLSFPIQLNSRGAKIRRTLRELFPNSNKIIKRPYPEYCILAYLRAFSLTYPLFFITNLFILLTEGANDGFVSIKSARKGEVLTTYKTDHIGLIGHFFTQKRKNILKNIIKTLESKLDEN